MRYNPPWEQLVPVNKEREEAFSTKLLTATFFYDIISILMTHYDELAQRESQIDYKEEDVRLF